MADLSEVLPVTIKSCKKIWEHKVKVVSMGTSTTNVEQLLNKFGEDGFELINAHYDQNSQSVTLIVKREVIG